MKDALKSVFLLFAMALSMAASAAPLTDAFVVPENGQVFTTNHAFSFEKAPGLVKLHAENGTVYHLPDSSGVLYNKLATAPQHVGKYIQVAGTQLHMNVSAALYTTCYNGSQTVFAYAPNIPARFFQDNCALHNAVKAASN